MVMSVSGDLVSGQIVESLSSDLAHTDFCLVQVTACSASQEDDWEGALEWRVQG